MAIHIIVEGGTPKHDVPSLCQSCERSQIIETDREKKVLCGWGKEKIIREKVVKCSKYVQSESVPMLYKTAWIYTGTFKEGKWMGNKFLRPGESAHS